MAFWTRRPAAALLASGRRIDPTDTAASQRFSRRSGGTWQPRAWNYRELIGELGAGLDYQADILSKVGFVIAAVGDDDEPIPLPRGQDSPPKHRVPEHVLSAAREVLDRLPFRNGYSFQGIMSICLRVAGECYLHGRQERNRERWTVLSTDEVRPTGSGFGIISEPGEQPVAVKDNEALLRLWKPHPRYKEWPDSPMRRLIDVCEDVVLVGRELRAAARSRVAANGILLIPNSLSVVAKADGAKGSFQHELEVLMLAPISQEGSAGSVVPVVLRGSLEELDKVRHITLAREDSPSLINKLDSALSRLRDGMSMPSDATTSVRDMNHWSAWSVTQDNWKNYLEPSARLIVDSLTEAYLRPGLTMSSARGGPGLTEDEADMVQVWYDAGNVTENANRGEDANDAYDRGAIGPKAYLDAKGFADTDAPDDEEFARMMAWKTAGTMTPEMVAHLVSEATGVQGIQAVVNGQASRVRREPVRVIGRTGGSNGNGTGSDGTQPSSPVPSTAPPGAVVSAGQPQKVLDSDALVTADRLAEIERSLRERLLVACDDTLSRALERAGGRVRSAVQGKKELVALAAELKGLAPEQVCALVGQGTVTELGLLEDSLLAQAFDRLRGKFVSWTTQAARDAVAAVVGLAGLPLSAAARLADRLTSRVDQSWRELEGRLRTRAVELMYDRQGEVKGERPDSLALPGDIRTALSVMGGDGGVALGSEILSVMDTVGDRVGITWRYGITPRSRTFEPHKALDAKRFTGWTDPELIPEDKYSWVGPHYQPGDHSGCLCDAVPTWLVADTRELLTNQVLVENEGSIADRLLAQMDDAAGRKGTYAQANRDERERVLAVQRSWIKETG